MYPKQEVSAKLFQDRSRELDKIARQNQRIKLSSLTVAIWTSHQPLLITDFLPGPKKHKSHSTFSSTYYFPLPFLFFYFLPLTSTLHITQPNNNYHKTHLHQQLVSSRWREPNKQHVSNDLLAIAIFDLIVVDIKCC